MTEQVWEEWKLQLEPVIKSKAEEWQILGYEKVTEKDVWDYFIAKRGKLEIPETPSIRWFVNEIFSLKVNDYMNWLTVEAFKGPSWFVEEEVPNFSLNNMSEKAKPSS